MARIVLYGLQGRTVVKGQSYSTLMAGLASRMSDEQIADVLTFHPELVRQQFVGGDRRRGQR